MLVMVVNAAQAEDLPFAPGAVRAMAPGATVVCSSTIHHRAVGGAGAGGPAGRGGPHDAGCARVGRASRGGLAGWKGFGVAESGR